MTLGQIHTLELQLDALDDALIKAVRALFNSVIIRLIDFNTKKPARTRKP